MAFSEYSLKFLVTPFFFKWTSTLLIRNKSLSKALVVRDRQRNVNSVVRERQRKVNFVVRDRHRKLNSVGRDRSEKEILFTGSHKKITRQNKV